MGWSLLNPSPTWPEHASLADGVLDDGCVAQLPSGWIAAPLPTEGPGASLRISLVLMPTETTASETGSTVPASAMGSGLGPIRLDQSDVADLWLGALVDRRGVVRQWLEVQVQRPAGSTHAAGPWSPRDNSRRDQVWRESIVAAARADPGGYIATGLETGHPPPMTIDPTDGSITVPLAPESRTPWALCTDDSLLAKHQLSAYSTSAARYLVAKTDDADPSTASIVAVEPDHATSEVPAFETTMQAGMRPIPFNLHAGFIAVRRLAPFPLDAFADMLDERGWSGMHPVLRCLPIEAGLRALADRMAIAEGVPELFLLRSGRGGRQLESLHLKLTILLDIWSLVRRISTVVEAPMLNLEPASFRVRIASAGVGMPSLWTARVELARPGAAMKYRPSGFDRVFVVPAEPSSASPYWPAAGPVPQARPCSFRPVRVLTDSAGLCAVTGQILAPEGLTGLLPTDLIGVRLMVADHPIELLGRFSGDGDAGVVDFDGYPRAVEAGVIERMRMADGVELPRSSYWRVPIGSTHADLHALGRIAVRVLLGAERPLADLLRAIDLLRATVVKASKATPPGQPRLNAAQRLPVAMRSVPDVGEVLGRRHQADESEDPIPEGLWMACLAFLLDATAPPPPGATQVDPSLFESGAKSLSRLVAASRTLILRDAAATNEMREVIERVRRSLGLAAR